MPVACPHPDLIAQYLDDRLPAGDSSDLETHLSACPHCVGRLKLALKSDPLLPLARGGGSWSVPRVLRERLVGLCAPPDTDGTRAQETPPPVGLGAPPELVGLLRPAEAPDELGRLGEYRILKVLGKGGMGVVCLAEDTRLGRRVALKLIRPGMATDERAAALFFRESRAVAALSHEHVVTVYQGGQDGDTLFLAMELLEGRTVSAWMTENPRRPLRDVLRTAREAAAGLSYAHSKGIVHRDFKPANLWRCADRGRIKLLDFGLARDPNAQTLTAPGQVMGTLPYMAPEQAMGKPADARADLFSLGVVLHELCTDVSPFARPHQLSVLTALAEYHPDSLDTLYPWLPADLVSLTRDLLAKDLSARVQSANAAIERLLAIEAEADRGGLLDRLVGQPQAQSMPVETPNASVLTAPYVPPKPAARRKRWPLAVGLAFGLLAAGVGLLALFGGGPPPPKVPGQPIKTPHKEFPPIAHDPKLPPPKAGGPVSPVAMSQSPEPYGVWKWTLETTRPRKGVKELASQPNGTLVAAIGDEGTVRLYDAKTRKFHMALVAKSSVQSLAWTPDGKYLIVPQLDGVTAVWHVESGRVVREFDKRLGGCRVSPDGKYVAGIHPTGTAPGWALYMYDLTRIGEPIELKRGNTIPNAVAWHPESKQLMVGYADGKVHFWDVTKDEPKSVADIDSEFGAVNNVSWRAEDSYAVAGNTGLLIHTGGKPTKKPGAPTWLELSPDGKRLAIYNGRQTRLIDADKPDADGTSFDGVWFVTWSPDGKELVTVTTKSEIQFRDLAGKALGSPIVAHDNTLLINSDAGHFPQPPEGDSLFVFVVQSEDGSQKTYTPDEFKGQTNNKWKNEFKKK